MSRRTPTARAIVGCLALAEGGSLNEAARLAGYEIRAASPVYFYRGRCYRRNSGARVVVRDGRIVLVSTNAHQLTAWLLRLGRRLTNASVRRAA